MKRFYFYICIYFLPFVIATESGSRDSVPHLCDASNESSEERCTSYAENSQGATLQAKSSFRTKFFLYTNPNQTNERKELFLNNPSSISNARPYPNAMWKVLVHGFVNSGTSDFNLRLKDAYLQRLKRNSSDAVNILVFDWSDGAKISILSLLSLNGFYQNAVENTKVAGETLGDMITFLADNNVLDIDRVHLIGHSLGAHVSGHAARRVHENSGKTKVIWRASALDPAGPMFWKENILSWVHPPYPRLHRNRVLFLDAYHTSERYGGQDEIGDVDFFINGGRSQPYCESGPWWFPYKPYRMKQMCSHSYSWEIFAKSINNDTMKACTGCYNYDDYHRGKCDCEDMPVLGEYADRETLFGYPLASGQAFYDIAGL